MLSRWSLALFSLLVVTLLACFGSSSPAPDEIPPVVTIDCPDQDDSFCDPFELEFTVRDSDPGLCSICIYLDGELVKCWEPEGHPSTFAPSTPYYPPFSEDCGEVELELVAVDCEGNEASENVDVYLCNDTTDPVVILTPATTDLYNSQCVDIVVDVTEDNYVSYEYFLNGNLEGSGNGTLPTTLTFCGNDLDLDSNTITFEVTDYCGNVGTGSSTIAYTICHMGVIIQAYPPDPCKCGEVTFEALVDDPCSFRSKVFELGANSSREMPSISEVCFFFDGENVARYCDNTPPYEYNVNVNDTFGPETHTVWARAILDDGTYGDSESVIWVKSCEPEAVIEVVSIDQINSMVTVNAGLSSDDNVEPGLTFEFDAPTCAGNWTTNQIDPHQSLVTFTFDTETCGYGEHVLTVTVFDGWCGGMDTDSTTVLLGIDEDMQRIEIDGFELGVYGDFQDSWPLSATATVVYELEDVSFYSDEGHSIPPIEANWLCTGDSIEENIWGCEVESSRLPEIGGWYFFHAMASYIDFPDYQLWATQPHQFWKSDMPTALNLAEEHADGNYYDNVFLTLPFTVNFTDDNLADNVTTYTVVWDFSDGTHYETTVGELAPGTSSIVHSFAGLGSYTLDVYLVEHTPVDGTRNVTVTSLTETWNICLEVDPPAVTSFDVQNIEFSWNEGPYGNDWVNPNDFLVSEDWNDLGQEMNISYDADDVDVGNCVSGCDFYTLDFVSSTWTDQFVGGLDCGEPFYPVNWDGFQAGEWVVTFTVYDKAGNSATMSETVTKSNFPNFSTLDFYTNEWPLGTWNCFQTPVGVPVRFDDWNSTDDSGYPLDSLLFEFTSSDGTNVWTEEIFSYNPNTFSLPWVYWFDHYNDMTARIWSCDVWGQWDVSDDFMVNLQDICAPDQPEIDWVQDEFHPPLPVGNPWERIDLQSSDVCFHVEYAVGDRDGESGPFGHSGPEVARVEIIAFNVADGYNGDPSYWTDYYGDGYEGNGQSIQPGVLAVLEGSGSDCAVWDADGAFNGLCGFYYVYAQAVDVNNNRSEPSIPVAFYKYSQPTFTDCYVTDVGAELCMSVAMECDDDTEYTFDWDFGDVSPVELDAGTGVCHTFATSALRNVSVDFFVDGNFAGTCNTSVAVNDEQDPWVTSLDIAPYHPIDAPNENEGNSGWKSAQYGDMYYDLTALDNSILQGVGGAEDEAVTVELWTDDDGLVGGNPGTFIETIQVVLNPNCKDNEVEWRFMYNWDGKDRGYYFFRARAHDRSGNSGNYTDLQLFHSDPPGSNETGGVFDIMVVPGDSPLTIETHIEVSDDGELHKIQFDRVTNLRCFEDLLFWSYPGFIVEAEFSPPFDPDLMILDFNEAGYGIGHYSCTSYSNTSRGPACRVMDEDGIFSMIKLFEVESFE